MSARQHDAHVRAYDRAYHDERRISERYDRERLVRIRRSMEERHADYERGRAATADRQTIRSREIRASIGPPDDHCGHSACRQTYIDTGETRCNAETSGACRSCGSITCSDPDHRPCNERCLIHADGCGGTCDHYADHTNGCCA